MKTAYGTDMTSAGQGGSIPLCNVFRDTYPDAEIVLMGVEEPLTLMYAPNRASRRARSPGMALVEALFLQTYGRR
jgi:hypothetical protein